MLNLAAELERETERERESERLIAMHHAAHAHLGQMTAQQKRALQRLAKRNDEKKRPPVPAEGGSNAKASTFVPELSSQDLESSLRVDCDELWNKVRQAHSRLEQEQQSGIIYVHHIVAHTLNHPEARWLGRYLNFIIYWHLSAPA